MKSEAKLRLDKAKVDQSNAYDNWTNNPYSPQAFFKFEKAAEELLSAKEAYKREQASTGFFKNPHNSIVKFITDHQGL